jgi:hypothetical protein
LFSTFESVLLNNEANAANMEQQEISLIAGEMQNGHL